MKYTQEQIRIMSEFKKKYLKQLISVQWGVMKFSKTSKEHQDRVYEICYYLYKNNIPFATEVEFTSGYNPDIICPTYIKPIIEVRHSETNEKTIEKFKRIPEELQNKIIYVDTKNEWSEKLIQ